MTIQELANKNIQDVPADALSEEALAPYLALLENWKVDPSNNMLVTNFQFEDFASSMDVVIALGSLAEDEEHHPNFYLYDLNNVLIQLKTHSVNAITERDIVMAAKIESIFFESNV